MRHLDDAELIRYVDGEHPPAEAEQWRRHVKACDACRLEVDTIQAESARFSEWLARADFEADLDPSPALDPDRADALGPPRAPTRPAARGLAATAWLKAAVIVLLLAAPLAAFPGVRTWVVSQVTGGADTPVPTTVEATAGPVVRFEPAAGPFAVQIDGTVEGSALLLERADGAEAVLRMDGDAEPVVSAGVLRIRGAQPDSRYRLALPAAVSEVRVRAGDREIRVTAAELDAGRRVELGG